MALIRYREGVNRWTGEPLIGWPDCRQSMAEIITTLEEERVMLLDFSGDVLRWIGRNTVAPIVTKLYRSAFTSIRRWEPEFRPAQVQLLYMDALGGLALGMRGRYFPEGRYGNYALSVPKGAAFAVRDAELLGQSADLAEAA